MMASPNVSSMSVSHVTHEGVFFVIWGQLDKKNADNLQTVINNYAAHFDSGIGAIHDASKELVVGAILVAKHLDNQYYRVLVQSVDHKSSAVSAFFVDFGHTAQISFDRLRTVSLPKEKNFLGLKHMASKYLVANLVLHLGKEETAVHFIRPYIVKRDVSFTLVDPNIQSINVKFLATDGKLHNLAEVVITKNFGSVAKSTDQFYLHQNIIEHKVPLEQLQQPPPVMPASLGIVATPLATAAAAVASVLPPISSYPVRPTGFSQPFGQHPGVAASVIRPLRMAPSTPTAAQATPSFRPVELLTGRVYKVLVSFVEDDMTVIVQRKETVENELVDLMTAINQLPVRPIQKSLEPGTICLARYSVDQRLCRGIVIRVNNVDDTCNVYFSDYGNKEFVKMSEIYEIPDQYAQIQSMAYRCVLANVDFLSPITPQVREVFEDLVTEKILNLKVLPSETKTKILVDLSFASDNRKVIDAVLERTKPLAYEAIHIPKGESVEVVIAHAINAARFYVQRTSNQAALDKLMHEVETYCGQIATKPSATRFTEEELSKGDLLCCALFEGKWYRAIVTDFHPPDMVTVRYVDYGNESEVSTNEIIPIPPELVKFRAQAVECCLNGYTSRRETDEEAARFEALLAEHEYTFTMTTKMHLQGAILLVELWDKNNRNVRTVLQSLTQEAAAVASKAVSPPKSKPQPDSVVSGKESNDIHSKPSRGTGGDRGDRSKASSHLHRQQSGDESSDGGGSGGFAKKRFNMDGGGARRKRISSSEDEGNNEQRRSSKFGGDKSSHKYGGGDVSGLTSSSGGGGYERRSKFGNESDQRKPRYGGGSEGNERKPRFGGGSFDGERKPRFGDENERRSRFGESGERGSRYGGGGSFDSERKSSKFDAGGGASSADWRASSKAFGDSNNRFNKPSGGGGDRSSYKRGGGGGAGSGSESGGGGGGGGNNSSWTRGKKTEDFTKSLDGGKAFRGGGGSYLVPKKAQLLDPYPAGSKCSSAPLAPNAAVESIVSVTHYESPHQFWVQWAEASATFLSFMNKLQSDYIKRKPIDDVCKLTIGDHVIAQFKDDQALYRAEIVQILPELKVKFIDYGNVSVVTSNRVWALASDHCQLPIQSVHCRLANALPMTSSADEGPAVWPSECVPFFTEDQYKMRVLSVDETSTSSQATVELVSVQTGKSIVDELIGAGLCVSTGVVPVAVEDPVDERLLVHQALAIHVAYIENSSKFFVHVEPDKLDIIAAKVKELVEKPEERVPLNVDEVSEGQFVLASCDGSVWYRARVVAKIETGYQIQFIDYGDRVDVTKENIRDLPEALCTWSPQAMCCCLYGNETPLDEAAETDFLESYSDTNITVFVTGVDEQNRLSVLLYNASGQLETKFQSSTSFTDVAANVIIPKTVPLLCPYPVLRQGEQVFVSHTTPTHFYVQKVSDTDALNAFVADLHNFYSSSVDDSTAVRGDQATTGSDNGAGETTVDSGSDEKVSIQIGTLCAAKSVAFETWYRAQILSVNPLEVFYVDFGNTETLTSIPLSDESSSPINRTDLKPLNESHLYPPSFALKASFPVRFLKDSYDVLSSEGTNVDEVFVVEYARRSPSGSGGQEVEQKGDDQVCGQEKGLNSISSTTEEWIVDLIDSSGDRMIEKLTLKGIVETIEINPFLPADSLLDQLAVTPDDRPQVTLTSFDSPSDFSISLCANETAQSKLNEQLQSIAHRSMPILSVTPPSELCLGKFVENNLWYRSAVLNNTFEARFVDFGNKDVVPQVRKLAYAIRQVPYFSLNCALPIVSPSGTTTERTVGSEWSQEAIDRFDSLVNDKTCTVQLLTYDPLPIVDLFVSEESSGVEDGGCGNNQKSVSQILIDEKLAVHSTMCKVVITHVNSVHDFYVQNVICPAFDDVCDALETIEIRSAPLPLCDVSIGTILAAKFPVDNVWYRAKVVHKVDKEHCDNEHVGDNSGDLSGHPSSASQSGFEVLFIDFGNTCVASEFRQLPRRIERIPGLAKNVRLKLSQSSSTEETVDLDGMKNKLIELSAEGVTEFNVKFVDFDKGSDIVEVYSCAEDGNHQNIEAILSEPIAVKHYMLTHINSANDFYMSEVDHPTIDVITAEMESVESESPLPYSDVNVGDLIGARFVDDKLWYRARVVAKEEDASSKGGRYRITVLFIDYGNKSIASEFRRLSDQLKSFEPVGLHCALMCDRGDGCRYGKKATEKFIELSAAGETIYTADFVGKRKDDKDGLLMMDVVDLFIDENRVVNLLSQVEDVDVNAMDAIGVVTSSVSDTAASNSIDATNDVTLSPSKKVSSGSTTASAPQIPELTPRRTPVATESDRCIVSWVNSPDDFYIQEPDDGTLETIQELISSLVLNEEKDSTTPLVPSDVSVNDLVAAQSTDDELWYRAKVVRKVEVDGSSAVEVFFVDYGNTNEVKNLRRLAAPLSLSAIPACAKRCRLLPPGNLSVWPVAGGEDSEDSTTVFERLMADGPILVLEYIEERHEDGGVSTIELYMDGGEKVSQLIVESMGIAGSCEDGSEEVNVLEVIKEVESTVEVCQTTMVVSDGDFDFKETISSSNINEPLTSSSDGGKKIAGVGASKDDRPIETSSPNKTSSSLKESRTRSGMESNKVHVIAHVNSPDDFYLMTDPGKSLEIGNLLNDASEFERVDAGIVLFSLYAVFNFNEDSWYRAILLNVDEDEIDGSELYHVKYVDLGHTDVVSRDKLRELPDHIREIPYVVRNCALETDEECILWTEEATRKFSNLVERGQFHIERINNSSDPARVILRTIDGVNVNDLLLEVNRHASEKLDAEEEMENEETCKMDNAEVEVKNGDDQVGQIDDDFNDTLNDTIGSDVPSKNLLNENVIVTHYKDPNEFHVQVVRDETIVKSIENLLSRLKDVSSNTTTGSIANTGEEDEEGDGVDIGELYAGFNAKDDKWVRVRVLRQHENGNEQIGDNASGDKVAKENEAGKIGDENQSKEKSKPQENADCDVKGKKRKGYKVQAIDYGYTIDNCDRFKYLTEDLKHISELAYYCSLKKKSVNSSSNKPNWTTKNVDRKFRSLIHDELIVKDIEKSADPSEPHVVELTVRIDEVSKLLEDLLMNEEEQEGNGDGELGDEKELVKNGRTEKNGGDKMIGETIRAISEISDKTKANNQMKEHVVKSDEIVNNDGKVLKHESVESEDSNITKINESVKSEDSNVTKKNESVKSEDSNVTKKNESVVQTNDTKVSKDDVEKSFTMKEA